MCFSIVTFIRLFTPLYVSGILLSMMSGIYPPQVKVYELKELSMKFERHMISEIVDFQVGLGSSEAHSPFTMEKTFEFSTNQKLAFSLAV